ncbi:MAG TPA: hypothetical protein VFK13_01755 [Gemmatimonadaceae bacterium]|nr:hypothetical protein [Gemmatimonadaceae bacterium]
MTSNIAARRPTTRIPRPTAQPAAIRSTQRALAAAALLALALLPLTATHARAQDTTSRRDSLASRVDQLERATDSLRLLVEQQTQRLMDLDARTAAATPAPGADTSRRVLSSSSGIYGKPFVHRFGAGTAVGGYIDLEYTNAIDAHESALDQHRFIPFIYSEITDRLHVGAEMEFEHGARVEVEDGEAEGGGEVRVEFATIDYRLSEGFNVRGGLVLAPLGRFNLIHDSPINDLTDRPLVDQDLIPTTLAEPAFGAFGTLYPSARSVLTYELYVTNGFSPRVVSDEGIRTHDAIAVGEEDVPFARSLVGRVAFSPFLGLEVGLSAHHGPFARAGLTQTFASLVSDDSVTAAFTGDERLDIGALDLSIQHGPFELMGEGGLLHADLPAVLRSAGFGTRQAGFYLQGNYHFGFGWLAPRATSAFTAVVRYGFVDLDRDRRGADESRLSLGFNWRPIPDAAFKADYQWNWSRDLGATARNPQDRRVRVSMATYF